MAGCVRHARADRTDGVVLVHDFQRPEYQVLRTAFDVAKLRGRPVVLRLRNSTDNSQPHTTQSNGSPRHRCVCSAPKGNTTPRLLALLAAFLGVAPRFRRRCRARGCGGGAAAPLSEVRKTIHGGRAAASS